MRFMIDRAGLVGNDGPTHHGCYDLAYLGALPNIGKKNVSKKISRGTHTYEKRPLCMKETFEKRPTRTDLRITAYVGKLPSIGKKNMSKGTHVYGKRPTKRNPRIAAATVWPLWARFQLKERKQMSNGTRVYEKKPLYV